MTILGIAAILLCTVSAVLTLAPLLRVKVGLVRVWDFPRPQIAAASALSLVGLLAGEAVAPDPFGLSMSAIAIATLLFQGAHIVPYVPFLATRSARATTTHADREFSVLIANVKRENKEFARLRKLIEDCDPDIVLVLEPDESWRAGLEPVMARYPIRLVDPLDNHYGMIFLTRMDMVTGRLLRPVRPDIPAVEASLRTASGFEFDFYGLHPIPPMPDHSSTERDIELLVAAAKVKERSRPAIVAGDLNDVAWSRTTQRFLATTKMIDPRIGRGFYATFHADYWFLRWPLDHVFYSDDFKLVALQTMPHIGSDHFPIFVRLQAPR